MNGVPKLSYLVKLHPPTEMSPLAYSAAPWV